MTGTDITISEAARRNGLSQQEASFLILASPYETAPSHGNAKLCDSDIQGYLAQAAANIRRKRAATAAQ